MRHLASAVLLFGLVASGATQARPHNVILFVADGLRPGMVNAQTAPTMTALMQRGVRFTNTHSLFPTFTTANASGMATGHMLGDTGDFSNTIYTGFPVAAAAGSATPFLENDPVLGEVDQHFGGSYLNEQTILAAAREAGLSTATIGKLGPTLIFDHTDRSGEHTVIVDDMTGRPGGIPLPAALRQSLTEAGVPDQAPTRGDNGHPGDFKTPGTAIANVQQQNFFADVAVKAVLPMFKRRGQPFVMVFWSRDPDGTQHNQGDSLGRLLPGINGPTSIAAIANADADLARLLAALDQLGLAGDTDVVLTSDHGFSTISKDSATSFAATASYKDVPPHLLPPGFVAIDLAHMLDMKLFDPDAKGVAVADGAYPAHGNGLIGEDPAHPRIVIAANGGSDLVYLPDGDRALAARVVEALSAEDYVSGLFVDAKLGPIPGTLPLAAIALQGSAVTPTPAIVINFRSFGTGCADPTICGAEIADTALQQGQGMHGSFSRADTRNVMAAAGPDFKQHFADISPASNADIGKTIARLLDLRIPDRGTLGGRVLAEAMPAGETPPVAVGFMHSTPDAKGLVTILMFQAVGETRYFDAAGYPGRTLGVSSSVPGAQ